MNSKKKLSILIFVCIVTQSVRSMDFNKNTMIVQNNKKRFTLHDGNFPEEMSLMKAVRSGAKLPEIEQLIAQGANIDEMDAFEMTALRAAIAKRKFYVIQYLVQCGATVTPEDLNYAGGWLPQYAKQTDKESSILDYLISETDKNSALKSAIVEQNKTLVKFVLTHKPLLTPSLLTTAANHNSRAHGYGLNIAEQLIAAGVRYNAQEVLNEVSPDQIDGNYEYCGYMKDLILKNGWVPDATGALTKTVLMDAVEKGDLTSVKALTGTHIDARIHTTNDAGETAFTIAAKQGQKAMVDALALPYLRDRIIERDYKTVDYILSQKPQLPPDLMETAVRGNDPIVVKKLLDAGIVYHTNEKVMNWLKDMIRKNYVSPEVVNLLNIPGKN